MANTSILIGEIHQVRSEILQLTITAFHTRILMVFSDPDAYCLSSSCTFTNTGLGFNDSCRLGMSEEGPSALSTIMEQSRITASLLTALAFPRVMFSGRRGAVQFKAVLFTDLHTCACPEKQICAREVINQLGPEHYGVYSYKQNFQLKKTKLRC